ncbi:MAG: hypothetical protein FWC34_00035 [Bacteroidetes bacterium]|nr:hypothetical protein [Bacteroidota bacterium]
MNKLDKNATEKAKEILEISTNDISTDELYDKLYEYRISQHPDKYQVEEAKKVAEENFKKAGNILEILKKDIELQLVNSKPSEIVPFQKIYDNIQLKQNTVELQNEIQSLKTTLDLQKYEIKDLKKELKSLRSEKLNEKKDELKEQYTPSKKGFLSNGIVFILTFIAVIFTKIEDVASILTKYSPIPDNVFNYILFGILVFIPLRFIYLFSKQFCVNKIVQLIITPPVIQQFVEYLKSENKADNFSEINVYNFIINIQYPKNKAVRFFSNLLFGIQSHNVLNQLKDIFIYNLLSKQLIEISNANNLDRNFRIVKGYSYHISLDDIDF